MQVRDSDKPSESAIDSALRQFEAAEANLDKLERIFNESRKLVPGGICFGGDLKYEDLCRDYSDVLEALPKIDGWKPEARPIDLNDLAQGRLDAQEIDEVTAFIAVEEEVDSPTRELADYRHRLNKNRRSLVRAALQDVIAEIDSVLQPLRGHAAEAKGSIGRTALDTLGVGTRQIERLLGSSVPRPAGWEALMSLLEGGEMARIAKEVWPAAKASLLGSMYRDNEPVPVSVEDLGQLTAVHPRGAVATKLAWERLTAESLERLVFSLIGSVQGYENPGWLMKTNAPDRGRDLSVTRVVSDPLGGVIRSRVIIQCRNWASKSVGASEVAELKEQMAQWAPPRIDVLVIATTGRFTADAVSLIEKHNNSDRALRIEMWPESHLERLLAHRPGLIAEFQLR